MTRLTVTLVAVSLFVCSAATSVEAAPATDLLPDLQMAPLFGVDLQAKHGQLRLRFGTLVNNIGDGPLIVTGRRPDSLRMKHVYQRVSLSDGTTLRVAQSNAIMYFEAVGVHDHWHLRDFITMRLTSLSGSSADRLSTKIGFCFYDTSQLPPEQRPPNSTDKTFTNCGTENSNRVRMGISVGWGDAYLPAYEFQDIDVTGLPGGRYRLCAAVNPHGLWQEKTRDNNSYWLDLRIRPATRKVVILDQGASTC